MNIKLTNVRLSFPALFEPKKFDEKQAGKPKYSATFILDKKKHAKIIAEIKAAVQKVLDEKYGKGKMVPAKLKGQLLRDGAEKEDVDGYGKNVMFLSASSERRPVVVNRDKSPLNDSDNVVYAGCYVNASIRLWPQDNQYGKRVNAALRAVQFAAEGEPFGEKAADPDEEFEDVSGGAGDDDMLG